MPCRTRGHVQFALRAQLNELKNCHALQLGEEVPKKTQLTGTLPVEPYQPANHPWVVPVILPDRQESDKMAELPHRCSKATGIKASGVGTKRLCGNISPATDRMPTAAQVPNRNGSPSVVSIRRRPRNASNGKTFKTDGPSDPEVMAAEKISITSSIRLLPSPEVAVRSSAKTMQMHFSRDDFHQATSHRLSTDRTEEGEDVQGGAKEWSPGWQFACSCLLRHK